MMVSELPLFPEQASSVAANVDTLFIFLCVLTGGVSLLVFVVIFFLAIKYRRTPQNEIAQDYEPPHMLEVAWIVVPSIIFIGIFLWGSWLYFHLARVPDHQWRAVAGHVLTKRMAERRFAVARQLLVQSEPALEELAMLVDQSYQRAQASD